MVECVCEKFFESGHHVLGLNCGGILFLGEEVVDVASVLEEERHVAANFADVLLEDADLVLKGE